MTFVSASLASNRFFTIAFWRACFVAFALLSLNLGTGHGPIFGNFAQGQITFGGSIGAIAVEGNQRFSDQAVILQSGLKVGDSFDAFLLNDALKRLYSTGNYADVGFSRRGNTLVIRVEETLFVNRIIFSGNSAYKAEDLARFISLKPTDPFSKVQLQRDVNIILSAYAEKGFYNVSVEPKVNDIGRGRVDVRFAITEGRLSRVSSVNFVGNRNFSDGRLRRVVSTKQQSFIRGFTSGDAFGESKLAQDMALLEQFYKEQGYADFRLISAQGAMASDRSGFVVTFVIEEGPRYRINDMRVQSNMEGLDSAALKRALRLRRGSIYKASAIVENEELLRSRAESMGFATAIVTSELETTSDKGLVDVIFKAEAGPRVTIERIEIRGNLRTRDEVIRREMRLAEGDGFSANGLQRSLQRIRNLGYFGNANIRTINGSSPDKTVVIVEVEEASTGSLNFGGGVSSGGTATFSLSYNERNFLGRGQTVNLTLSVGEDLTNLDASFKEPWFLGREIGAGVRGFYSEVNSGDNPYDRQEIGVSLELSYKLSEKLTQGWSYTLKHTDVSNVTSSEPVIIDQEGSSMRSIVEHRLSFFDIDSTINPTDGYLWSMSNSLAGGIFGGDVDWLSTTLRASYYRPLGEVFVFRLRGQAGYISSLNDNPVPLVDRFSLGQSLVRGFRPSGIGPRTVGVGSSIGATTYYGASAELMFPIPGLAGFGFKGRFFVDTGTAFERGEAYTLNYGKGVTDIEDSDAWRASTGVGITWASPVGPINFDWSNPEQQESFDRTQSFQFGFGLTL